MEHEAIHALLDQVLSLIDKLPDPPRKRVRADFEELRHLYVEARAPRIAFVGRRGAGKSSLLNAIVGEQVASVGAVLSETGTATWHSFESERGSMRILDTRGLGDHTRPSGAANDRALDDVTAALDQERPDVLLFLCKAKDVDSRIREDVADVAAICKHLLRTSHYAIPVIAVVTQVDELDPKNVEQPYAHPKKQEHIRTAEDAIRDAFDNAKMDVLKVIPTSAYAEYEEGRRTYHNCWNIDRLTEYLVDALPQEAKLIAARLTAVRRVQIKYARLIVKTTAGLCAGIAAAPIPIPDILPITAAQMSMVTAVAFISGKSISKETARGFLAALGVNVGAAVGLKQLARALGKVAFPGVGSVVSGGIALAGTWGIGEAAIAYFIEDKPIEEVKRRQEEARAEHTDPSED